MWNTQSGLPSKTQWKIKGKRIIELVIESTDSLLAKGSSGQNKIINKKKQLEGKSLIVIMILACCELKEEDKSILSLLYFALISLHFFTISVRMTTITFYKMRHSAVLRESFPK